MKISLSRNPDFIIISMCIIHTQKHSRRTHPIPSSSPTLPLPPTTPQPQRILPRLLLAPQRLPQFLLLRILLPIHIARAHARDLAMRPSATHHPAHQRIHHVAYRARGRLETFAERPTNGAKGRVYGRARAVAVAAEEGIWVGWEDG